jgi:arylsulfatase A-like enzyme
MKTTSILAAALLLCTLDACSRAPLPNVILITVDTLRADHVGAYGYNEATTPTIDKLARQGRLFQQATTPFPRTSPAIASLFTGLEPQNHGSREIWQPIISGTTLAEHLQVAGYRTIGVSANPAAGSRQQLHRGFDTFVEADELPEDSAEHVTDAALQQVRLVNAEEGGLFLWVHYMDPHFPYDPPSDPAGDPASQPQAPECRRLMGEVKAGRLRMGHVEADLMGASSRALDDCRKLYDAEIQHTDLHLGRLLAALQQEGRMDGALVVFTADHGENLGEDDLFYGHGMSLHDASVLVPLIFVGADIETGVDALPIRLEDVAPTLLGLLGQTVEQPMDGLDQSARLRGRAGAGSLPVARIESGSALNVSYTKRIFSGRAHSRSCIHSERYSLCAFPGKDAHLYDHENDPFLEIDVSARFPEQREQLLLSSRQWQPEQVRERAVRDGRFKLLETPLLAGGFQRRLYDLREDPAERIDVSTRVPAVFERLSEVMDAWSSKASLTTPIAAPEDVHTLRSLGYIE